MSISVDIFYGQLKRLMGDPDSVQVNGSTVGECLNDLSGQYSGIDSLLFNKQRQLLRNILVYVNAENACKTELTTRVRDGDKLIIMVFISGG
jgi:molybdopterin converting factor small subunit